MQLVSNKNFNTKLKKALFTNRVIKERAHNLEIKGDEPWSLDIEMDWKNIGKLCIQTASIYDLWAIKEWYFSLSFRTRKLASFFPIDHRIENFIAIHLKKHWQKKDLIFNAWKNDKIVGHFFITDLGSKPVIALAISDAYQKNNFGQFILVLIIHIFKLSGFESLYLTTMHENKTAFNFYKKLGFEYIGDAKVPVPGLDYCTNEYEMRINLDRF